MWETWDLQLVTRPGVLFPTILIMKYKLCLNWLKEKSRFIDPCNLGVGRVVSGQLDPGLHTGKDIVTASPPQPCFPRY